MRYHVGASMRTATATPREKIQRPLGEVTA